MSDPINSPKGYVDPEELDVHMLAHELRNTLAATDMFLERALESEELGTDPLDDVRAARRGIAEALEVVRRRLDR